MNKPPKIATWFLRLFCDPAFVEMIEGDLHEEFQTRLTSRGKKNATLYYWWSVIRSFRPYLLKRNSNPYKYTEIMLLHNYFKIAYRNLIKQKLYTSINVIGLTAGMASSLLILLFVKSELTFDQHHERAEDVFRVSTKGESNGETMNMQTSPLGLAFKMKSEFPEVEEIARLSSFVGVEKNLVSYEETKFFQDEGYLADSAFFKILKYDFAEGNPATCLNNSGNIVISRSLAEKIAGNEPALGKIISIENSFGKVDYEITGVFKEPVKNTHLKISFVTSMNNPGIGEYIFRSNELLGNNFVYSYLRLNQNASPQQLVSKFPAFLDKYVGEDMEKTGFRKSHDLINVADIHLKAKGLGFQNEGDLKTIYILSTIAGIILLIACINFMNMATAQSGHRSREIGVRKVFGAQRISLANQFLTESVLITLISLIVSIGIVYLLLPSFNQITGQRITLDLLEPAQLLIAVAIGFITGFIAGSYPAFHLSGISINRIFKNKSNKSGLGMVRKGLVIFQFLISISLIVGVITINQQLNFVQSRSLGFQKENQIAIPLRSPEVGRQYKILENEFSKLPGIVNIGAGHAYPGKFVFNDNSYYKDGSSMDEAVNIRTNYVDFKFMNTLGVEVINGREFSEDFPADVNTAVVLNEAAVRNLGYELDDVVGRNIHSMFPINGRDTIITYKVSGVVKDFNFQSLYEDIIPYMFTMSNPDTFQPRYLLVSVNTNNYQNLFAEMKTTWDKQAGGIPFEYTFMDDDLNSQYKSDESLSFIVKVFTTVAIIISALGLFALSSFTAESRLKEMGVRKVMGASGKDIFLIMSGNFSILILISFVLSIPPGWYFIRTWLNSFAFRIDINPWIFLLAGAVTFAFAILVVSYQCLKVSLVNPVNVLKDE